jgi:hypothetical protein
MNRRAWIVGRIVAGALVLAGAATSQAAADETMPERSGPWAFTARMATTPSAEDENVWLLLACEGSRLAAAVMNAGGFPFAAAPGASIVLRFAGHPDFVVEALPVSEHQLAISAVAARRLLPLIIDSERAVVVIGDGEGEAHSYTFSLQPNGRALAAIVRGCWDDR